MNETFDGTADESLFSKHSFPCASMNSNTYNTGSYTNNLSACGDSVIEFVVETFCVLSSCSERVPCQCEPYHIQCAERQALIRIILPVV